MITLLQNVLQHGMQFDSMPIGRCRLAIWLLSIELCFPLRVTCMIAFRKA